MGRSKDHASVRLAECYIALGLDSAAEALLARVGGEINDSSGYLSELRAGIDARAGNWQRAFQHILWALDEDETAERWTSLAEIALALGDDAEASRACERAIELAQARGAAAPPLALLGGAAVAHRRKERSAVEALEALLGSPHVARVDVADALCDLAQSAGAIEALLVKVPPTAQNTLALEMLRERIGAANELEEALARDESRAARLLLALRLARRRGRDKDARLRAVKLFDDILEETEAKGEGGADAARVHLLLATIHDDEREGSALAEQHYRAALKYLPRDVLCANNLGVIALGRGDLEGAREWLLRAIRTNPRHETSYANLARTIVAEGGAHSARGVLVELARLGLGTSAAANLLFSSVDLAQQETRYELASKGHQLKNLLGVVGARLRSATRRSEGAVKERLERVSERLEELYDEWAACRTMREESGAVDSIAANALASDVAREMDERVELRLGDHVPDVMGLRAQLREALVNLLRNALEAQPQGTVQLCTRVLSDGSFVEFAVVDEGPGFLRERLRQVRAVGFTTKREGSGLGLALVDRIARAHNGRLELSSTVGEGTTARLVLPVLLDSQVRRGMLGAGLSRILKSATADELVVEE